MFGRERKMKYDIPIVPLDKPTNLLTKKEAQKYFDWYIGVLDERMEYLREFTMLTLDYSSDSLVPLWSWFLKHAEIEYTPQERLNELEEELKLTRNPLRGIILAENAQQFTLETEYIMHDIAMYLGEVFVKNHPSVFWGFYTTPKSDSFVNCPVLLGFPNEIYPEKKGCWQSIKNAVLQSGYPDAIPHRAVHAPESVPHCRLCPERPAPAPGAAEG